MQDLRGPVTLCEYFIPRFLVLVTDGCPKREQVDTRMVFLGKQHTHVRLPFVQKWMGEIQVRQQKGFIAKGPRQSHWVQQKCVDNG